MREEPFTIEALLVHAEWVRRLATRLGATESDDVVQEAWLAALNKPPRDASPTSVRRWLATVVRRMVHRTANRQRERSQVEAAIEPPAAWPSALDSTTRVALLRTLAGEVMGLRPEYREIVIKRFFEDLPPRRIATELGISAPLVRTRLHLALRELRTRLERQDFAEHGRFLPALLLAYSRPARRIPRMAAWSAIPLCVLVALVALKLDEGGAPHPADPLVEHGSSALSSSTRVVLTPGLSRALPQDSSRVAGALDSQLRILSAATREALQGATLARVNFVGCDAILARSSQEVSAAGELSSMAAEDATQRTMWEVLERAPFELERLSEAAVGGTGMLIEHGGYAPQYVSDTALADARARQLPLLLRPVRDLEVYVREEDGAPVRGVYLRASDDSCLPLSSAPPANHSGLVGVTLLPALGAAQGYGPSDLNGLVVIPAVPLDARPSIAVSMSAGEWVGETHSVDAARALLVVRRKGSAEGVLLMNGIPVAREVLVRSWTDSARPPHSSLSNVEGHFELNGMPPGPTELRFTWLGHDGEQAHTSMNVQIVAGERTELGAIELSPSVPIRGRVAGWSSSEVNASYRVRFLREGKEIARTRIDAEGGFCSSLSAGPYAVELMQGERVLFSTIAEAPNEELVLDPVAVTAMLEFEVAGSSSSDSLSVLLQQRDSPATSLDWRDLPAGRVALPGIPPGLFDIMISGPDRGRAWHAGVRLSAGSTLDLGEVLLGPVNLRVRLTATDGSPRPAARIELVCVDGLRLEQRSFWALTDGQGAFEIAALPQGRWAASCEEGPCSPLFDVRAGMGLVELVLEPTAQLILSAPHPAELSLKTPDGRMRPLAVKGGRARATGLRPGCYEVRLGPPWRPRLTAYVKLTGGGITELSLPEVSTHTRARDAQLDGDCFAWLPHGDAVLELACRVKGDTVEVPVASAPIALVSRRGADFELVSWCGATADAGVSLRVELSADAMRGTRPSLRVLELPGFPRDFLSERRLMGRAREVLDGSMLFSGLPTGAHLELEGRGRDGRAMRRVLEQDARHARWW